MKAHQRNKGIGAGNTQVKMIIVHDQAANKETSVSITFRLSFNLIFKST